MYVVKDIPPPAAVKNRARPPIKIKKIGSPKMTPTANRHSGKSSPPQPALVRGKNVRGQGARNSGQSIEHEPHLGGLAFSRVNTMAKCPASLVILYPQSSVGENRQADILRQPVPTLGKAFQCRPTTSVVRQIDGKVLADISQTLWTRGIYTGRERSPKPPSRGFGSCQSRCTEVLYIGM